MTISTQASSGGAVQTGMLWWKIELDKSGAILTCERVDDVSKGSKLVTYVQATTKADACSAAKEWWQRRKQQSADRVKAVRKDRKERGLCVRCGRNPLRRPRSAHCETCHKHVNDLRISAKKGRPLLKRPAPDAETARSKQLGAYAAWKKLHPAINWTYSRLWDKLHAEGAYAFEVWLVRNMSQLERDERGLHVEEAEAAE